ncbi:MAG TPA: DUF6527 family protein [Streptosporangiaceae bacterium]|nr:DUF6527 family protein [Streptosporangiaceae bacterium]
MGVRLRITSLYAKATRRNLVIGQTVEAADLVPRHLPARAAILVASNGRPSWAAFTCPCGNGHQLMISLIAPRRASWQLSGPRRAPTIHPSIDVVAGGHRCHFWIRRGHVEWADPPRTRAHPREEET